jgi:hypothetical protein
MDRIVDETLEPLDLETVHAGDLVGIHTGNALGRFQLMRGSRRYQRIWCSSRN